MPLLKKILLLFSILVYILIGLAIHLFTLFLNPRFNYKIITRLNRILSIAIRKILGLKLYLEGKLSYLNETGNFIIANHVSYLDGIILSSLFPVIFVTKLEVKSWPVFGWIALIGKTIFIDRKKKLGTNTFINKITDVLKEGINVLFFPEGTSSDGSKILPFKHAYFQAPLNCRASVIPITIQYIKINYQAVSTENRDKAFWYGQVSFTKHVLNLLKQKQIEAKIIIHTKIETHNTYQAQINSRKQLSSDSFQVIERAKR